MGLDSVFGNFGQAANLKSQATVSRANARVARAQGAAAKGQAYGQAARIETANKASGEQAVENMERVQRNATLARGEVRTQRGASGFTSQGSGQQAEVSVLERYEQTAMDMAQARSLQDMDARFSATMSRKSGDLAEMGAEANYQYGMAQADMQQQMAKNAKHAGILQLATTLPAAIIGTIYGGPAGGMMAANLTSGFIGSTQKGVPGTYESTHETASTDIFSQFMGAKLSQWMS